MFCQKQPHFYNDLALNYKISEFCGLQYRSPQIDFNNPYICCVGNSFTFGRFVKNPYPAILSEMLDMQVLNLGFAHLQPRTITRYPILMRLVRNSLLSVVQFKFNINDSSFDFIPAIKLNWHDSVIDGVTNIKPVKLINKYYPDQMSHDRLALILAAELNKILSQRRDNA